MGQVEIELPFLKTSFTIVWNIVIRKGIMKH